MVTVDCAGNTIAGPEKYTGLGNAGIVIDTAGNITIKNCIIENFEAGAVDVLDARNLALEGNTLKNSEIGLNIRFAYGFTLNGNSFGGNHIDMQQIREAVSSEKQPVPVGQNVGVVFPISGVSISFGNVTRAGEASLAVMNDPAAPPQGYELIGKAYNITTTAVYDNTVAGITVSVPWCAHCLPVFVPWCAHCSPQELEPYLELMHHEQGEWQNVTTLVDTANGIISGNVSSLSPFAVMLLMDPVAATEDLVDTVANMNLHKGIHNSLDAKLSNALSALTDKVSGNDASAVNKLNAFINECEAQSGKHLAPEQGNKLIVMADAIVQTLMN
jgi:hypothetical protein